MPALAQAAQAVQGPAAGHATPPPLPAPSPQQPTPPPLIPALPLRPALVPPKVDGEDGGLEQFLGVKLFAWVGGLALFLGIVFFVKYAFERELITEAMRITAGFVLGAGLVAAGVLMRRSLAYQVLAQTLAATGVLVLYGVNYAAYALYDFPAFTSTTTFAYMALITTGAFALALRMEAPVVAVLGMAGGFLTPVLVNTGQDQPLPLFTYVLLLDLGLIAVALRRRWDYLVACAAGGTLLLTAGWFLTWFWKGGYADGTRVWIPLGVHLFFPAVFAAASLLLAKLRPETQPGNADLHAADIPAIGGLALAGWSLVTAFLFAEASFFANRPVLLFGYLFGVTALVLAQIWARPRTAVAQWPAALLGFVLLATWSNKHLSETTLTPALVGYLVFGLMHTGFALAAIRLRPEALRAQQNGGWLGPVSLLLTIAPVLSLPGSTAQVWPAVLVLDLMIIGMALVTLRLGPVLMGLLLTLVVAGVWLFRLERDASPWGFLAVLGGFALLFAAGGAVLSTRLRARRGRAMPAPFWITSLEGLLPLASAALPFMLLNMATLRLNLPNPGPVYGLGLLLGVGFLTLMRLTRLPALGFAGLILTLLLQLTWFLRHFEKTAAWPPLLWAGGFALLYAAHPFLWRRHYREVALPWITSACAWLGHFPLLYWMVDKAFPNDFMGLLPGLLAVPALLSMAVVLKLPAPEKPAVQVTQAAWFGGTALFFISAVFPTQFDQHWIVGWALEGAALCWLRHRVPHDGLRVVGVGLLAASVTWLLGFEQFFSYHVATGTQIWNATFFEFGVTSLALAVGAAALKPPLHRWENLPLRALLYSASAGMLFSLVNYEIAHAFTPTGESFTVFNAGGNLARDMSYTIAWALFALGLLVVGFSFGARGARHAGLALLALTLLKLFFVDLARLGSIYRIGALMAVAVVALGASFLYQRFYARLQRKEEEDKDRGGE